MTNQHPIIPSPELVELWSFELEGFKGVDTIRKALEALPND